MGGLKIVDGLAHVTVGGEDQRFEPVSSVHDLCTIIMRKMKRG